MPAQGPGAPPGPGVFRPVPPAPVIMPPLGFGPPGDTQGLGPVAGFGPPPGPMYPNPGPYAAPMFQPAPDGAPGGAAYGGAPHWWTSLDYLLYFNKSGPVPFPLATTSAPSDAGLLGRASTLILAGNKPLSYNPFSGFRVTGGFYGDADRRYGFEASGWLTETKSYISDLVSSPSAGIPTLARPFIDSANIRANTVLLLANPGLGNARVLTDSSSRTWSIEANGLVNLYRTAPGCKCTFSLDFLAGYRYLELDETLSINSATQLNVPGVTTPIFATGPFGTVTQIGANITPVPVGFAGVTVFSPATLLIRDDFRVANQFNGGQVGLRGEGRYGMVTLAVTGKLAFGLMHQRLEIAGGSGFNDPTRGSVGTAYGGLFANASNIGNYNNDEFVVIPEANINLGLNITRGLTTFIGYNFLYINKVARPGDQINPIVNTAQVPASANYGANNRPMTVSNLFVQSEYWIMGVNFGLQLRY